MPRFHFNIYDGYSQPNLAGTNFLIWCATRFEALRLDGKILADGTEQVSFEKGWYMEAIDERGLVLFLFDFTAFSAAAVECQS